MEEKHAAGFVINDRRGEKKEAPAPTPVITLEPERETDEEIRHWKSVGFVIAQQVVPGGPANGRGVTPAFIIMGRAVGLRSDDGLFVADWCFSPLWPEHTGDWTQYARKRLDTFLDCECRIGHGMCSTHKIEVPNWMKQDSERLNHIASQPMPEAVEVMVKAEQTRSKQPRILKPRG